MTTKAPDMELGEVAFSSEELTLTWKNASFSVFRALWLRDNDPAHRDARTGQRLISLLDFPADPRIEAVEQRPAGHLTLCWDDGTKSVFPLQWFRAADRDRRISARPMTLPWMGQPADNFAWLDIADWMAQPTAREDWLYRVARDGIAFLQGVPVEDRAVLEVALRIGYVRETNYGRVFDVPCPLRIHTDGPYRDPVPGFQLIHCLRSAGKGGESRFVDGLAVAERLRVRDPEAFATLSQTLIRYRFRDGAVDLRAQRAMIEVDPQGQFRAICYNDCSIAPLSLHPPLLNRYYAAYRKLAGLLNEPARFVKYLLRPGDLVLFDNTRILHGHTALSLQAGAPPELVRTESHLQGCYIDADGLYGTLAVLARKEGVA